MGYKRKFFYSSLDDIFIGVSKEFSENVLGITGLSVLENLEVGAYGRKGHGKDTREEDLEQVFHLFPKLKERQGQLGGSLSGGEQQMLAIARGLMARPRLLLLDEPSLGLAPVIIEEIFDLNFEDLNLFWISNLLKSNLLSVPAKPS